MAGASLLTLLDDVAAILDDVAVMSKVAAKKTAGVLGDDLALNAQQVNGVNADRELPVVWKVFKGSAKNKMIIIPAALGLSAAAPWAITPILMAGGLYLCYEGAEKVLHTGGAFLRSKGVIKGDPEHGQDKDEIDLEAKLSAMTPAQLAEWEEAQIKGAVRTDFILSAEIVVIALGTMAAAPFLSQVAALSIVGAAMTVGVYGAVAGIVKMGDVGLHLMKKENPLVQKIGEGLVKGMGPLMKGLTIVGTAAMFMVGGGILAHAVPSLAALHGIAGAAAGAGVGIAAGLAAVAGHSAFDKIKSFFKGDKGADATPDKLSSPQVESDAVSEPKIDAPKPSSAPSLGRSASVTLPSLVSTTPSSESAAAAAEISRISNPSAEPSFDANEPSPRKNRLS